MPEAILELNSINKSFGKNHILKDLSLKIYKGEFITLLGPSGCGKTTTLRCIAGFENVDNGEIILNGKNITDVEPSKRNVNTVFQNYALFPHMNVYDNIAYGPKIRKVKKGDIACLVDEALDLVKMKGFEKRMPDQLSGGQRQRIAIARALINKPDMLLLDEPLGALDLKLRQHMQAELKQIKQASGITFVYVTHDQEEALNLSDRLVILNDGVVEQIGTPEEIYRFPKTLFAAEFVGNRNIIPVTIESGKEGKYTVALSGFRITATGAESLAQTNSAMLAVHPDMITIHEEKPNADSLEGIVVSCGISGSQTRTVVSVGGAVLNIIEYNKSGGFNIGQTVFLSIVEKDAVLVN